MFPVEGERNLVSAQTLTTSTSTESDFLCFFMIVERISMKKKCRRNERMIQIQGFLSFGFNLWRPWIVSVCFCFLSLLYLTKMNEWKNNLLVFLILESLNSLLKLIPPHAVAAAASSSSSSCVHDASSAASKDASPRLWLFSPPFSHHEYHHRSQKGKPCPVHDVKSMLWKYVCEKFTAIVQKKSFCFFLFRGVVCFLNSEIRHWNSEFHV